MMHHDQSKLISNEFIYHSDGRYVVDDGMIDEFMIPGGESSFNELNHIENPFNNKSSITSSSNPILPIMNEDYFGQISYNQMPNILNNNSSTITTSSNQQQHQQQQSHQQQHHQQQQQYNFHTLQPANQQIQPNHHQNLNQYLTNPTMPNHQSPNSYSPLNTTQNPNNQQSQQQQQPYIPKQLVQRASSFNSSPLASNSLASSPSSSLSSSSGSTLTTSNSNHQFASQLSLPCNLNSGLAGGPGSDFDPRISSPTSSGLASPSVPTDPAEIVRLKQARNIKLTPEEVQLLVKDRQRKDNHNMIERRRRFNINDRINELRVLLPKNGEFDAKQNKGSILKASVDYIIHSQNQMKEMEKLKEFNKRLIQKLKEYEIVFRAHSINIGNDYFEIEKQKFDSLQQSTLDPTHSNNSNHTIINNHENLSKLECMNPNTTTTNNDTLLTSSSTTLVPISNNNGPVHISNMMDGNAIKPSNYSYNNQNPQMPGCYDPNAYGNQSEQVSSTKPTEVKTRKYNKSNTKKRASLEIPASEIKYNTSIDSSGEKRLKQEPVSPTEKKLPTDNTIPTTISTNPTPTETIEPNSPTKLAKICSTVQQASPKYVIAKFGSNNRIKNLDLSLTLKANSDSQMLEQNTTTITPLIKLMTTNSKDPTLTSSSVGSPVSSPSSTNSSNSTLLNSQSNKPPSPNSQSNLPVPNSTSQQLASISDNISDKSNNRTSVSTTEMPISCLYS